MDLFEAIYKRQSIRAYDSERSVSDEKIFKILGAACQAPSAGNIQPWRFVVVRDESLKKALAWAALGQRFIAQAPVVIVVCADLEASERGYGRRGTDLYALQDTAAATQNLLLAAWAEGLGTCWVGAFDEKETAEVLKLPSEIRPVAIIPVGYPSRIGHKAFKKSPQQLTKFK